MLWLALLSAEASPCEERVSELQARVSALEQQGQEQNLQLNEHLTLTLKQKLQLEEVKAQLDEQKAQLEELRDLVRAAAPSTTVKFGVDRAGTGRALSEATASSSMAVHAWQTHEFPEYRRAGRTPRRTKD